MTSDSVSLPVIPPIPSPKSTTVPPPAPVLLKPGIDHSTDVAPLSEGRKIEGRVQKSEFVTDRWLEFYEQGNQLYSSGKYKEAYEQWRLSLAEVNGQDVWSKAQDSDKLEILKKLAMMHKTQNQPAEAAQMYNLALVSAVKVYGKDSAQVAALMLDLGRMYTFSDQIKSVSKANEYMTEAFRINEKLYGRFTIPTGDVAIAIAQLKEKEKLFEQALPYWQLAIDIGDRCEPDIISCCRIGPRQGKARCLDQIGSKNETIAAHQDLIAMCRKGAPTMMKTVLNDYASYLTKSGQPGDASAITTEVLTFQK